MYLLVPNKFIYLCAPRTGSRTTREALEKHCGAICVGEMHHAYLRELEDLPDLPVYSMIRDPYDFVCSAFARDPNPRFEDFLHTFMPDVLEEWDGAMTPYEGFVDHYYVFENTLEDFFVRVGFPGVPLTHKGRGETPPYKPMPENAEKVLRERFPEDFARYEYWRKINQMV